MSYPIKLLTVRGRGMSVEGGKVSKKLCCTMRDFFFKPEVYILSELDRRILRKTIQTRSQPSNSLTTDNSWSVTVKYLCFVGASTVSLLTGRLMWQPRFFLESFVVQEKKNPRKKSGRVFFQPATHFCWQWNSFTVSPGLATLALLPLHKRPHRVTWRRRRLRRSRRKSSVHKKKIIFVVCVCVCYESQ